MLMFPRSIPGSDKIRQKAMAKGEIREKSEEQQPGLRGFVRATLQLIKNRTLVLICVAMSARVLIATGLVPFLTKITFVKFGAKQSESNFIIGALIVSGTTGNVILKHYSYPTTLLLKVMFFPGTNLITYLYHQ